AAAFNQLFGDSSVVTPRTPQTSPSTRPDGGGPRGLPAAYQQRVAQGTTIVVEEPATADRMLGRTTAERLKQGLNEFPDLVRDARLTLSELRETLDLADRNFRNLEGFTEPLGRNGEQIAQSITKGVEG